MEAATPEPSVMEKPTGIIVVLCGLPAAGKSSLARLLAHGANSLLAALPTDLRPAHVVVRHISFDSVLGRLQAERGASTFDPVLWHEARELILSATRAHFSGVSPACVPGASQAAAIPELNVRGDVASACGQADCLDVVLLDDNMHYRSMRRPYYRLAHAAHLGFCTVCLPIETVDAVARDSARPESERVGAATIELMASTLQWPRPEQHAWERHTVAPCPQPASPPAPQRHVCRAQVTMPNLSATPDLSPLWDALALAATVPVSTHAAQQEEEARASERLASAVLTAESAAHQLDLRLRKAVSARMQAEETAALPPKARAELAKKLSELRRDALAACKTQHASAGQCGDAEAVADALEHSFALCVLRHLESHRSPMGLATPGGVAASTGATSEVGKRRVSPFDSTLATVQAEIRLVQPPATPLADGTAHLLELSIAFR